MKLGELISTSKQYSTLVVAVGHAQEWSAGGGQVLHQWTTSLLPAFLVFFSTREQIYNILWALVFGFATLNILSLGARHVEQKSGLNFGEILAILVVMVSLVLLGWEMLYTFHVLPIRLNPR